MGLLCGLAVTLAAFSLLRAGETSRLHSQFIERADERSKLIVDHIRENVDALKAVGDFYAADIFVNHAEFQMLVGRIFDRHRTIAAVDWVARVMTGERISFEQAARRRPD